MNPQAFSNTSHARLSSLLWVWATILIGFSGCIRPYEGSVEGFEDVLVVNARITDELKTQQVVLSRSYRFEEFAPEPEENALVTVVTDTGVTFLFEETTPGTYSSVTPFAAGSALRYELRIQTENGRNYRSEPMQLPPTATLDEVTAELTVNSEGREGVGIFVNSSDPSGNAVFYRFDFIETYKIIAPYWSPFDAVVVSEGDQTIDLRVITREREERTCYGNDGPEEIILRNTRGLAENRIEHLNVRFLDRDNAKLSYRYSILVRQYVQNPETYSYYETLKGLSDPSQNVFSEDQPGFLAGNIFAVDNEEENVAGFFEVSSVSEKRIFFNREDFFPDASLPPYFVACEFVTPNTSGTLGNRALLNAIREDKLRFYDYNTSPGDSREGPFLMVRPECGDCTVLGSNRKPDFWIE